MIALVFLEGKSVPFLLHISGLLVLFELVKSIWKVCTFRTCIVIFAIYYRPSAKCLEALEFLGFIF